MYNLVKVEVEVEVEVKATLQRIPTHLELASAVKITTSLLYSVSNEAPKLIKDLCLLCIPLHLAIQLLKTPLNRVVIR
jgi:hypothetical protein